MSLINKMLQDLDARGTPAADAFPSHIKPVAQESGRLNRRVAVVAAAAGAGALAVLAAGWFGISRYQAVGPAAASAPAAAPISARPAAGMSSTITVAPNSEAMPAPRKPPPSAVTSGAEAQPEQAAPAPMLQAEQAEQAAPEPGPRPLDVRRRDASARQATPAAKAPAPMAAPKSVAPFEPDSEEARAARRAIAAELEARMAAGDAKRAARLAKAAAKDGTARGGAVKFAKGEPGVQLAAEEGGKARRAAPGRQESAAQRAEGEYRRALSLLQDGRTNETVASLEQALKLDPTHDAARQTLVGLLIEARRFDDAMRQLQLALVQDPRQPALAMLLARLQIERGGPALDTLVRTAPYAGNNADYHAFMAGVLQREQRHREAAAEYQAALRVVPGNGVWWMGLGMSLQADKRSGEALEAFQRARASGTLSTELQAFVERRLQQLGR